MAKSLFKTDHKLDTDFDKSAKRLEELKRGRDVSNIPLNDEYWVALRNHRLHHDVKRRNNG
jgi:hypothetical protein